MMPGVKDTEEESCRGRKVGSQDKRYKDVKV